MPPDTTYIPAWPLMPPPPPQYRHLVVKSGTTAGKHHMSSACGSGCCFMRCTPTPTYPLNATQEKHLVSKIGTNLGPVDLSSCSIVCNRPSWVFSYVTPNGPDTPYIPCQPLMPPSSPPVQASSGQEWYYCRSPWHVFSLWVRVMFCQMYLHPHLPHMLHNAPQGEASGGQEWY